MMVSIVIPIYNVEAFLKQCFDTVYSQLSVKLEVILVNDGSTDNSLLICEEYAKKYSNTIIINKENGGLSDARNAGTVIANGEYIYYLDSDDWLSPNAIKTLFDYAVENQCEIVQGGFYYAYDDHLLYDAKYKKPFVLERKEAMLELIKNDYVKNFAWGKLYRADIAKKHQFPKGKFYEDSYWQHLIIHECTRYGIIPSPLYYYRQRKTGISGAFSLKNLDLLRGYEERMEFVKQYYPEYLNEMASTMWNIAYSFTKIAGKGCDQAMGLSYAEYWHNLNKDHSVLFSNALATNVLYKLWKLMPWLIPLYDCINSFLKRFVIRRRFIKKVAMAIPISMYYGCSCF